jgi:hypothetical protein
MHHPTSFAPLTFFRHNKYISSKDKMTLKETLETPELFQKQTVTIIPNHDLNFVINTDRT